MKEGPLENKPENDGAMSEIWGKGYKTPKHRDAALRDAGVRLERTIEKGKYVPHILEGQEKIKSQNAVIDALSKSTQESKLLGKIPLDPEKEEEIKNQAREDFINIAEENLSLKELSPESIAVVLQSEAVLKMLGISQEETELLIRDIVRKSFIDYVGNQIYKGSPVDPEIRNAFELLGLEAKQMEEIESRFQDENPY